MAESWSVRKFSVARWNCADVCGLQVHVVWLVRRTIGYTARGRGHINLIQHECTCDITNLCSNEAILLVLLRMLSTCHTSMPGR